MSRSVERVSKLILQVGTDKAFGGLRTLYQGLSEERARRFVGWLESASEDEQVTANIAVGKLLKTENGQRVLRHVCRDVLFGTETISLAALALVASAAAANPGDLFLPRAAHAIDGLADEDAIVFLAMLKNLRGAGRDWLPLGKFRREGARRAQVD